MPVLSYAAIAANAISIPGYRMEAARHIDAHTRDVGDSAVVVAVLLDTSGGMIRCDVLQQAGDPRLAARICQLLPGTSPGVGRFADGTPAPSYIIQTITAGPNASTAKELLGIPHPNSLLANNLHLDGYRDDVSPPDAFVDVSVDDRGSVTACEVPPFRQLAPLAMIEAACSHRSLLRADPERDANGLPIAYVRSLRVHFDLTPRKPVEK